MLLLDTELPFLALLAMRLPLVLVLPEDVRMALQRLVLMRSLKLLGIKGPHKSAARLNTNS